MITFISRDTLRLISSSLSNVNFVENVLLAWCAFCDCITYLPTAAPGCGHVNLELEPWLS